MLVKRSKVMMWSLEGKKNMISLNGTNMKYIEVRNEVVKGRNRKIYMISTKGLTDFNVISEEWNVFSK